MKRALIGAAVTVLILSACSGDGGGDSSSLSLPLPTPTIGGIRSVPTQNPSESREPWGPEADILSATIVALDEFWTGQFPGFSTPAWYFYDESSLPTGRCGGTPGEVWHNNSAYCYDDTTMYLNLDYLRGATEEFTNAGAVAVVAHEYGHAVADAAGLEQNEFVMAAELGADCLSGVFARAIESGGYAITPDPGDAQRLLAAADAVGDMPGEGFHPNAHGSGHDRSGAYATGYISSDREFCSPYFDMTEPIAPVTLAQYSIYPILPGGEITDEGAYVMESSINPEWRTAVSAYATEHVDALSMANDFSWYFDADVEVRYSTPESIPHNTFDIAYMGYTASQGGEPFFGIIVVLTDQSETGLVIHSLRRGTPSADEGNDPQMVALANTALSLAQTVTS